jgi:hypothetical protein
MADRAGLPMPFLRPWETGKSPDPADSRFFVRICFAIGGIFGLGTALAVHLLAIPPNPGTLVARLSTFPFAAIVTETVVHLFVMSGLILLTRRTTVSNLISALAFLFLFHPGAVGSAWTSYFVWGMNYLFAVATGWAYSRYGIEGATLTHAVAHAIVLGIN